MEKEKENVSENANVETCNGEPKPTNRPTPNGEWECTSTGWQWVPEIG